MKTVFFESLHYKFITKNDFYYGSCPDIRTVKTVMKNSKEPHYFDIQKKMCSI